MAKRRTSPYSIRLSNQLKIALEQKADLIGLRPATLAVFVIAQYLDPENSKKSETLNASCR